MALQTCIIRVSWIKIIALITMYVVALRTTFAWHNITFFTVLFEALLRRFLERIWVWKGGLVWFVVRVNLISIDVVFSALIAVWWDWFGEITHERHYLEFVSTALLHKLSSIFALFSQSLPYKCLLQFNGIFKVMATKLFLNSAVGLLISAHHVSFRSLTAEHLLPLRHLLSKSGCSPCIIHL